MARRKSQAAVAPLREDGDRPAYDCSGRADAIHGRTSFGWLLCDPRLVLFDQLTSEEAAAASKARADHQARRDEWRAARGERP